MGYAEFKSKFLHQLSLYENTKSKIDLCKNALDRAIKEELPLRDSERKFHIRDLSNSEQLRISYKSSNLMCKYSEDENRVFVGTLSPSWASGWKKISKDSYVSKLISDFFHYANQYIYRGYQINLLGAIALTYKRPCDFRGYMLSSFQLPLCNSKYASFCDDIPEPTNKRNQLLSYYVRLINAFDPYVNRVIHYYIRALSLLEDGYDEEAITSADNSIDIVFQAVKHQQCLSTKSRSAMYDIVKTVLNLPARTEKQLMNLYQLRCAFSAHPAQTNWWDFSEIYEINIHAIIDAVKTAIIKFLLFEEKNRNVVKETSCWSEWFVDNCDIVYDAVWFHKLPALY